MGHFGGFLRLLAAKIRNAWRSLTSMGTALVLLFLLALGAIPGALLPQRSLNAGKVNDYLAAHPVIGPWLDALQAFDVFSSFWFTAIYMLLFVSLVGCLTPRMIEHARSLRAMPVAAPRNLARLPKHTSSRFSADSADLNSMANTITGRLRGWRSTIRHSDDGAPETVPETVEVSAEKGYLRELGNLVFHFSLLGLLVAVAVGKLFGYEGNVIVIADGGPGFCSASPAAFDSFRAGNTVDGTSLHPMCVRVNDFAAHYLPSGQATSFAADIDYQDYQSNGDLTANTWRPYRLEVNHPLRIGGDRVYLQGHGYAPTFTVIFPDGQTRTSTVQWRPDNPQTLLSSGVVRIDPPARSYPNPDERRKHEIAIQGLLAPTAQLDGVLLSSRFPALNAPAVAIDIYRGDTGLDTGRPESLFSLDPRLIESGPADQRKASQPARRRPGPDRPGPGGGHHRPLRRGGSVREPAGIARPRPDLGAGFRHHDDGRTTGIAAGAPTPRVGPAHLCRPGSRPGRPRYGERRAGRPGAHRQFRVGRRVRATDREAAGRARRAGKPSSQGHHRCPGWKGRKGRHMNTLHVNIGLARYSDWAFTSAVVALVVALLLLAFELAYVGGRRADNRALVSAGPQTSVAADSATPGVVEDAAARPFDERVGRAGLAVVYLGIGLLLACVVLRGLATMRVPWGNMYEFINLTCLSGLVAGAVVLRRPQYRPLWVFLLVPVLVLLTVSGRWLYTNAAPVMPALQSYWLPIHVSVVSLGSGVFLVAGISSILFLLRTSRLGDPDNPANADSRLARVVQRLPDAQTLDRIAYRTTIFAFPVFGFGVIFGAIWAEEAWGRYWGWDPKETVSFVAWVIYAAYLHARSTAGWRDRKAAWINVAGFVAMVFNLFFVNLVTVGLHSYAGVG